jgi:hypothetical protein
MANYYVNNSSGSDLNNGTSVSSAWATLGHALIAIPAGQYNTLYIVKTGLPYDAGANANLPTKTTIATYNGDPANYSTWAQVQGVFGSDPTAQDISLWCLYFEGKNLTYECALWLSGSGIYAENLLIQNYWNHAVSLNGITSSTKYPWSQFGNVTIQNCSYGIYNQRSNSNALFSNAVLLGDLTNMLIHNISVDCTGRGGQGVTKAKSGATFSNVKILNSSFTGKDAHNGNEPTIDLEIQDIRAYGLEIAGCQFNSNLSLSSLWNENGQSLVNVHHCLWASSSAYAIELAIPNTRVHHNLLIGASNNTGFWAFGNFDYNGNNLYGGIVVDHNIIDSNCSGTVSMFNFSGNSNGGVTAVNNTVISRNANTNGVGYFPYSQNGNSFINNIFYNTSGSNKSVGISAGFNNNVFASFSPVGINYASYKDPGIAFVGTGTAYYQLKSNSPAKNVGIPVNCFTETTDCGAIMAGSTPFSVGIGSVPNPSGYVATALGISGSGGSGGSGGSTPTTSVMSLQVKYQNAIIKTLQLPVNTSGNIGLKIPV